LKSPAGKNGDTSNIRGERQIVKQRTLWYTLPAEWNSSELKGGKMYGQNIHRHGAVHLTSYARDMLIRERTNS
jgi:hypothetical protein